MAWLSADKVISSTERSLYMDLNSTIQKAQSWMQAEGKETKMGDRNKEEMRRFVEMLYKRVKQKLENERQQKDKTDRATTISSQDTFIRKKSEWTELNKPIVDQQKMAPNSKIRKWPRIVNLTPNTKQTPSKSPRENKASFMRRTRSQEPRKIVPEKKVGRNLCKIPTPVQMNKATKKRMEFLKKK